MAIRKQLGIKSVVQMNTSSVSVHVDSGRQENFLVKSRILIILVWNPEYSSRNLQSR